MSLAVTRILVLLIALQKASPVKLPGSQCPTSVPPTHGKYCLEEGLSLILSIAFSKDVSTHLFREMDVKEIQNSHYFIVMSSKTENRMIEDIQLSSTVHYVMVYSKVMSFPSGNHSQTLRSDVQVDKNLLCPSPIFEEVRIWCEYPYIFIWSCAEGKEEQEQAEHEEALLVLQAKNLVNSSQEHVRSVARHFMSENLVGLIDLNQHYEFLNELDEYPFTCPTADGFASKIGIAVVIMVVIFLCLGCYSCL